MEALRQANCLINNSYQYVQASNRVPHCASVCLVREQERLFPIHLASMMGDPNAVSLLKPGKDQRIAMDGASTALGNGE
jgi:hypothetical protein